MFNLLFRKWWVVLLQGILLLFISFYIFRNPATVLSGISIWIGLLIFLTGVISLFTSMSSTKGEHKGLAILWSLLTIVFGFLLLTNILVTMKAITLLFGAWMLVGGIRFLAAGWIIRSENTLGWIVILTGLFSIAAAVMVMTNLGTAAIGISVLLGTQVLIAAIALIILAVIKKRVGDTILEKVQSLKK
jgi:uncharacterized membrane protein HdeD (DUF308 family)